MRLIPIVPIYWRYAGVWNLLLPPPPPTCRRPSPHTSLTLGQKVFLGRLNAQLFYLVLSSISFDAQRQHPKVHNSEESDSSISVGRVLRQIFGPLFFSVVSSVSELKTSPKNSIIKEKIKSHRKKSLKGLLSNHAIKRPIIIYFPTIWG